MAKRRKLRRKPEPKPKPKPMPMPKPSGKPKAPEQASKPSQPVASLRLPRQQRAAPLGSQTTDYSSATFATVPSMASVTSSPTQSLITAKTGMQVGPGQRVIGPGSRVALRVLRF